MTPQEAENDIRLALSKKISSPDGSFYLDFAVAPNYNGGDRLYQNISDVPLLGDLVEGEYEGKKAFLVVIGLFVYNADGDSVTRTVGRPIVYESLPMLWDDSYRAEHSRAIGALLLSPGLPTN
ncbi:MULTISPECIES: hypothetical protein [Leptolyngbya]|uniref:hypothetical protein n=1 Tax=Leptolyngbya TaxID=47251 RepID=UPI0016877DC5|nr:hypothetical protein [Leptolyngbya sp. FACHB-1624]MBD1858665.1 hypothetical protein [Leptolyngbya sp. FACHB-1624]